MRTFKSILAVLAIVLAIITILAAGVGVYYAWALNTPVTESLTEMTTTVEGVLTRADAGLTRVDAAIDTARTATSTIEGAVMAAGDRITSTDIAFTVLDRTVGDRLFPPLTEAAATMTAVVDTVVAANDALEAANRLPFVNVPTITTELQVVADQVNAAREQVNQIRTEVQTMKESAVSRPVTAITDRTGTLLGHLDTAKSTTATTLTAIARTQDRLLLARERLPRTLDWLSVGLTLALLWIIIGQAALISVSWRWLRAARG